MKPARSPARSGPWSMTLLMLAGLASLALWAALFEIDQTVRASGQVIASARTQVIQAADGGVLSKILVQEGQSVAAGQELAVLERDRSHAAYEESRAKAAALAAALARAQAEANEQAPVFNKDGFPQFVVAQQALYKQRLRSLHEELTTIQEGLELAQEELRMNDSLFKTGDISHLEVMRSRRQVGELRGKSNAVRNKYLQEARQEASKLAEDLSSSRYKLEERQDVLGHTVITAPVAGVVKYMKVTTIGGVLRAGDELMQISPTHGDMVIEVKVNPVDIGQLRLGLPVNVKLDAFDYSTYGTLHGTLSHISSDTFTEQPGSSGQAVAYYRAHVRVNKDESQANRKLATVPLKPGMTTTVDIRTNSRSVLRYLAKPVFNAFGGAMNER